jgi:Bacteriophage HK97-gp10, putative tail-component
MATFRPDPAEIRRAAREAALRELNIGVRQVTNRAKILTPVDTGRLRSSIRFRIAASNNPSAVVFTEVQYAPMVHDGTRPHVIRPRNAQALRFRVGGRTVFAKVVQHPGTRARPFLTRALREVSAQRGWLYREGGID